MDLVQISSFLLHDGITDVGVGHTHENNPSAQLISEIQSFTNFASAHAEQNGAVGSHRLRPELFENVVSRSFVLKTEFLQTSELFHQFSISLQLLFEVVHHTVRWEYH